MVRTFLLSLARGLIYQWEPAMGGNCCSKQHHVHLHSKQYLYYWKQYFSNCISSCIKNFNIFWVRNWQISICSTLIWQVVLSIFCNFKEITRRVQVFICYEVIFGKSQAINWPNSYTCAPKPVFGNWSFLINLKNYSKELKLCKLRTRITAHTLYNCMILLKHQWFE